MMEVTIYVKGHVLNFKKDMDYYRIMKVIDRFILIRFKTDQFSVWTSIETKYPKPFNRKWIK